MFLYQEIPSFLEGGGGRLFSLSVSGYFIKFNTTNICNLFWMCILMAMALVMELEALQQQKSKEIGNNFRHRKQN